MITPHHVAHVRCYITCVTCQVSPVRCYMSYVTCQVSPVACHVSGVTCLFFCSLFFGQSGEASRWRVCYQRGLPQLVSSVGAPLLSDCLHWPRNFNVEIFDIFFYVGCKTVSLICFCFDSFKITWTLHPLNFFCHPLRNFCWPLFC